MCGVDAAYGLIRQVVLDDEDATEEECDDAEWYGTTQVEGSGRRTRQPHERPACWLIVIGREGVWETHGYESSLNSAKRSFRLLTSRGLGDGRIFEIREDGSAQLYLIYTFEDYRRGAKC